MIILFCGHNPGFGEPCYMGVSSVSKYFICVLSWSIFFWFYNTVIDLIQGRFVIKMIIVYLLVLCTVLYVVVSFSIGSTNVDGNANNKNAWCYVFVRWLDKVWTVILLSFYQYAGGCWFSNMGNGFFPIMGFWSGSELAEVFHRNLPFLSITSLNYGLWNGILHW